ncbi:MAG: putative viral replication protein [Circoviridae sp.]|nr:MAG: putative viral replication protein [Circoviridae sp.]
MSNAKNWTITLNNYTNEDVAKLLQLQERDEVRYLCYGFEGAQSTPHIQGFISFNGRKRLPFVKELVGTRGHYEIARGTPAQNRAYCSKEGGEFFEYGELPNGQGSRTDLAELQQCVESGASSKEIAQSFFSQFIRYHRGIEKAIHYRCEPREWKTEVRVYWGLTGTGKTSRVFTECGDDAPYPHPGGGWFDGYHGQRNALFDDFGGSEFKLSYLLKLLDRYPMLVPVKGGFVQWVPRVIYITSNKSPDEWYANADSRHVDALTRRIEHISEMS